MSQGLSRSASVPCAARPGPWATPRIVAGVALTGVLACGSPTEAPAQHTLQVLGDGDRDGRVVSAPPGIDCTVSAGSAGGACSAAFDEGVVVTLTATAGSTALFGGWTAGPCDLEVACPVTMSRERQVRASFTGTLGVYRESGLTLRPDVDSFIGVFSGGTGSFDELATDAVERVEGAESLRATVTSTGDGFAGWFVGWGDADEVGDDAHTRDLSALTGGSLSFRVRSPVDLQVGIRSGNVTAGLERSNVVLSSTGSFVADDTWRQVCLDLSSFVAADGRTDLSRVKVFFVVAVNASSGGTGGVARTFWIDDVRWQVESCP